MPAALSAPREARVEKGGKGQAAGKGGKGAPKGKGGGKGPKGGCWQCGGSHYASQCPNKGKGKGGKGKGAYGVWETESDESGWAWAYGGQERESGIKSLCCIGLASQPKDFTHPNTFRPLERTAEEESELETPTETVPVAEFLRKGADMKRNKEKRKMNQKEAKKRRKEEKKVRKAESVESVDEGSGPCISGAADLKDMGERLKEGGSCVSGAAGLHGSGDLSGKGSPCVSGTADPRGSGVGVAECSEGGSPCVSGTANLSECLGLESGVKAVDQTLFLEAAMRKEETGDGVGDSLRGAGVPISPEDRSKDGVGSHRVSVTSEPDLEIPAAPKPVGDRRRRAKRGLAHAFHHGRCGVGCGHAHGEKVKAEDDSAPVFPPVVGPTKQDTPSINLLETHAPSGLRAVQNGEWEEFELIVDSGASETVVGEEMIKSAETVEGPMSRQGVEYEVANGIRIPNLGEKRFVGVSAENVHRRLVAQVCDVNKGLLSVSRVVRAGSRVVFDPSESYIEDIESQERMYLEERNGMFMLKLWTKRVFRGRASQEPEWAARKT